MPATVEYNHGPRIQSSSVGKVIAKKRSNPKMLASIARNPTASKGKGKGGRLARLSAGSMKKHRFKPGTLALREIRKYQKSGEFLIRRAPFKRLIKDVCEGLYSASVHPNGLRCQPQAADALQEALEAYIVNLFEHTQLESIHRNRITIEPKDMQIVRRIRNENL